MKFDDAKEKMSVIHKLHTARDNEGETIFYKKPYTARRISVVTNDNPHDIKSFDLDKVTHMSLSELGLLIQYKPVDVVKNYPFTMNSIEDIIVETK